MSKCSCLAVRVLLFDFQFSHLKPSYKKNGRTITKCLTAGLLNQTFANQKTRPDLLVKIEQLDARNTQSKAFGEYIV